MVASFCMKENILLIDGSNVVVRAAYSNKSKRSASKTSTFTIFARLVRNVIDAVKPTSINVFWDAPRDSTWRRKVYPNYKNRPPTDPDIKKNVIDTIDISKDVLQHMNVRQFYKDGVEADDLIYAACKILYPNDIIIMSQDSDYTQIAYRHSNVRVYDHFNNKFMAQDECDPAVRKALVGDTSDTIEGYNGIGKVNGTRLAKSLQVREEFLMERGRSIYIRNMLLIDFSYCPELMKNESYISRNICTPTVFDKQKLNELFIKYKLFDLSRDFVNTIAPFQLTTNESNLE